MFSQSIFWRHVGRQWFLSGRASVAFGASAAMIIAMTAVFFADVPIRDTGPLSELLWGAFGVLSGLSVLFLWTGMWHYWRVLDYSNPVWRRLWFVALTLGFWYGAVLYYVFVYLKKVSPE